MNARGRTGRPNKNSVDKYEYKTEKDPYGMLAAAIVEKACDDYMRIYAYSLEHRNGKNTRTRRKLERFFRSEWCALLTGGMNGERIITTLRKRVLNSENRVF